MASVLADYSCGTDEGVDLQDSHALTACVRVGDKSVG